MKRGLVYTVIFLVSLAAFFMARIIWPFPLGTDIETKNFFTIVTVLESFFLGCGLLFIFTVFSKYRKAVARWKILDWITFLSIAWILISGYPHDNTHIAHETSVAGLISIEIIFHGTLAIAAVIVTVYFLRQLKNNSR